MNRIKLYDINGVYKDSFVPKKDENVRILIKIANNSAKVYTKAQLKTINEKKRKLANGNQV